MTNRIEHKELGISFDIPDMKQRQVEEFARAQRRLRRERVTEDDGLLSAAADAVANAIRVVVNRKLRPSSPEVAAQAEIAARSILRLGAEEIESRELSVFEISGETCRAAAKLGWLGDVEPEEIDDWSPAKAMYLTNEIQSVIIEAQQIPPNS